MDGLDDLDGALAAVAGALSGAQLQRITDAAAQPMLRIAQAKVPMRTGETGHHIVAQGTHQAASATTAVEVLESAKGGPIHKAVFVEYGTENMPAEPFMRPAFEGGKAAAVQIAEQMVQQQLRSFT